MKKPFGTKVYICTFRYKNIATQNIIYKCTVLQKTYRYKSIYNVYLSVQTYITQNIIYKCTVFQKKTCT